METFQAVVLPPNNSEHIKSYKYRILVIDDDEGCAKLLMWTLEGIGQKAEIAFDGLTAIEIAKSFNPELILLDIGLPGMNGYEICEALRKNPALQDTFIVAQTGWGDQEHREKSKAAGFDQHLVKPLNIESLKSILLLLDQKKAFAEAILDNNESKV